MLARLRGFAVYARSLASVGPTPLARARIVLVACWLLARTYVPWLPDRPVRLRLVRRGRDLSIWVSQYADLDVIRELYIDGEYDFEIAVRPAVVFDLGGNIGLSALDFGLRWPGATVFVFEPDPRTFATLARNVAQLPDIYAMNVAVAGADGERTFFTSRDASVSSFERTRTYQQAVRVRVRSLDSLTRELQISRLGLLKIDIEGAEGEALAAFKGIGSVDVIIGELHLAALGCSASDFYAAHLGGFDVSTHIDEPDHCTFTATRSRVDGVTA